MRRRPRERAQPANSTTRKRKSRSVEAAASEEEEILISNLDDLLREGEAAAAWWTEDGERPADSSLADLLQELAACDEDEAAICRQDFRLGEAASSTAPDAKQRACRAGGGENNKNAQAARLNRLRKKEYVSGLEGKVARLSEDNQRLERERRSLGERVQQLEEETRYLKAVLANDSALSQLLGRLTGLGGVKLATSIFSKKEPREHDYALPAEETAPPGGGVCLHVDQDKVSVEFCPACSRSAASATKIFSFR
ncbi:PREDICTED: CREB/ATF bZIP transcription factor [Nanorana parkeri]|uniref:CREB/ATF bZIP transcription factor n=1 Tax=Nanorana parkeri TaxID=125878 RepID=UPI000854F881|nr:PREDICTED: CREB/ATF bZIP transcription factor [Nanorana parkeri]